MSKITVDENNKYFLVSTESFSYALGVDEYGHLVNMHWGGRIPSTDDLWKPILMRSYRHRPYSKQAMCNQEYPGWGGAMFTEPAIKASLPTGVRNTLLEFESYEVDSSDGAQTLKVVLRDNHYPLVVELFYRVYDDSEVIDRWSVIKNQSEERVTLESAMSACWLVPRSDREYRLTHLSGRWGKEGTIERLPVTQSKTVLETRTGVSGHIGMPFFALDQGASEESGKVWFGTLHWSGNWKIAIDKDAYEQIGVCGGVNDFDFAWPLEPGEEFKTPVFSAGYTTKGFGEASRILHRYQRSHIEPENLRGKHMPLIFNSYAALGTGERLTEENAIVAAEKAAAIGAELFVFDAGWQQNIGDWTPHTEKFPSGLKPVIDKVNALGMDFGLWVEIEGVETGSDLYKQHPEWILRYPGRKMEEDGSHSDRFPLNFAREDVVEHIYGAMHKLLSENNVRYLKLDMNRYFVNPGWSDAPLEMQKTVWVKYVRNLHGLFERLRKEFPEILFENCASGNGRSDYGMARLFGRINRSDNQDTLDILKLHEGFSWLHLPKSAGGGCHISDYTGMVNMRKIPTKFQAYTGMLGSLAIGCNLLECDEAKLKELKSYADIYKSVRDVVHLGEIYRLASHYEHPYAIFEYVSDDKKEAVLFFLGHSMQFGYKVPLVKLAGLDPQSKYDVEIIGNYDQQKDGFSAFVKDYHSMTGSGLMELGLMVELRGDFDAKIVHLKAIDK